MPELVFKEASTEVEIEQILKLNHRTFAEELGQHAVHDDGKLEDRFHTKNRYFIAVDRDIVSGMISVNTAPPFSIEKRLSDPQAIFIWGSKPCEVRLLAIDPKARGGMILGGLFYKVYEFAKSISCTHLLISGIEQRIRMYEAIGFVPIGLPVVEGVASFVPMVFDLASESDRVRQKVSMYRSHAEKGQHQ